MNKLKHIYWFAPFNINGPSTRYRGYYPINYINKNYAISTNFIFPQSSIFKKIKFILLLISIIFFRKKNALILIQKVCSTNLYAKSLKLLVFFNSKNTIYDIDDAEYLRQDPKTLHYFLKKCQSITVGSEKLKEYCKKFNNNVHLITSPVPVHQFKKLKRNKTPNIGWVGYYGKGDKKSFNFSHRESMFKILFPQLKKVKNAFILTIIGVKNEADISEIHAYFKKHPNIKIVTPMNLDWKNDRTWLYEKITHFDLGVSPLIDHLFNQSKSAFKAKQYLSVGIPTVASNIGENRNFVHHGENGFLVDDNYSFSYFINKIIAMSDTEYFEFSKKGLESYSSFSIKLYCDNIINLFK